MINSKKCTYNKDKIISFSLEVLINALITYMNTPLINFYVKLIHNMLIFILLIFFRNKDEIGFESENK